MFSFASRILHYHGDNVRRIFLTCAGVLMIATPLVPEVLPVSPLVTVIFILLIGVMAGLTNPRQLWVIKADTALSAIGFTVFEYVAITTFGDTKTISFALAIQQLLAICFFFALYFSAKTWRAGLLEGE